VVGHVASFFEGMQDQQVPPAVSRRGGGWLLIQPDDDRIQEVVQGDDIRGRLLLFEAESPLLEGHKAAGPTENQVIE
jgi:hypothetical protein